MVQLDQHIKLASNVVQYHANAQHRHMPCNSPKLDLYIKGNRRNENMFLLHHPESQLAKNMKGKYFNL